MSAQRDYNAPKLWTDPFWEWSAFYTPEADEFGCPTKRKPAPRDQRERWSRFLPRPSQILVVETISEISRRAEWGVFYEPEGTP